MKEILEKKSIIVTVLVIVIAFVGFFFWQKIAKEQKQETVTPEKELTREEILKNLSAPAETKTPISETQKEEILKSLSAPIQ